MCWWVKGWINEWVSERLVGKQESGWVKTDKWMKISGYMDEWRGEWKTDGQVER